MSETAIIGETEDTAALTAPPPSEASPETEQHEAAPETEQLSDSSSPSDPYAELDEGIKARIQADLDAARKDAQARTAESFRRQMENTRAEASRAAMAEQYTRERRAALAVEDRQVEGALDAHLAKQLEDGKDRADPGFIRQLSNVLAMGERARQHEAFKNVLGQAVQQSYGDVMGYANQATAQALNDAIIYKDLPRMAEALVAYIGELGWIRGRAEAQAAAASSSSSAAPQSKAKAVRAPEPSATKAPGAGAAPKVTFETLDKMSDAEFTALPRAERDALLAKARANMEGR